MIVSEPFTSVVLIEFPTQLKLGQSFLRLQEFYESPTEQFRSKFFMLDDYIEWYVSTNGKKEFTYYTDWYGFNVPSDIIYKFLRAYPTYSFTNEEMALINALHPWLKANHQFYLIGAMQGDQETIKHEMAHAFWALDPQYRSNQQVNLDNMNDSIKKQMKTKLVAMGYRDDDSILLDEIQAYLGTENDLPGCGFNITNLKKHAQPFQKTFDERYLIK